MRCRTVALVPLSQELCSYLLSTVVAGYDLHASRLHSATSLLLCVRMSTYVIPFWQKCVASPIYAYALREQVILDNHFLALLLGLLGCASAELPSSRMYPS